LGVTTMMVVVVVAQGFGPVQPSLGGTACQQSVVGGVLVVGGAVGGV
jgi:hypothetical protein